MTFFILDTYVQRINTWNSADAEIKNIILDLYELEAIKLGNFTLKSGKPTPIYIDLRLVISSPPLLKRIAHEIWKRVSPLSFDLICGVPYAALPFATALSLERDIPMLFCRKDIKEYGTKKRIEGHFKPGQSCLIIEDVITVGASILETVSSLQKAGLEIEDVVVIVDREQGGKEKLKEEGLFLHSLISVFDLLKVLFKEKKISEEQFRNINQYFTGSK